MARRKRVHFRVSFILPPHATVAEAREYVADAVASMKGCLNPGMRGDGTHDPDEADSMFYLDGGSVRVTRERRKA